MKEKRKNKYKTENRETKNWRQLEQKRIEEKMSIGTEENGGEEARILKRILNREKRGSTETRRWSKIVKKVEEMEKSGEGKYTEKILANRRKGGIKKEEQRNIEE